MYKRYCANAINNTWGTVDVFFDLSDYEYFEENNLADLYLDGAWEIFKCDFIHYYISTIPDQCENIILAVECPLQGKTRGLYRRDEHSAKFGDCEDCILPWLLTNF